MRPVEFQFLDQRAAHGLHHATFELVLEAVGVDDLAAVVRDIELRHADFAA